MLGEILTRGLDAPVSQQGTPRWLMSSFPNDYL